MNNGLGMVDGIAIAMQGDVPIVKAFLTRTAGGDRTLAESIITRMRAMTAATRRTGTIMIIIGIPGLIFFIGLLLIPAGIFMKRKATKQIAVIEQAYQEWQTVNP